WRTRYYVAAWQATRHPSQMTITASHDATHVMIVAKADTIAAGGAPAFAANVAKTVTLDAGGVLELASQTGDFTGSYVESDQPVQVIGGQYCANVPNANVPACDHLEESMIGIETLGKRYVVVAPAVPTLFDGKEEVVRIIATEPDTHLTYTPG